ncbi:probable ribosomal RNA-processing protein 17 at N-terminal half [Coccomyxa sp. Obi]|nr:probable ribosomal RNA-processing protein 17 at N-terminal half [Coccomyxa sp. Obi]
MQWGGPHAEENALSFADTVAGEDKFQPSHTKKRNKRQRGLEITFDPVAHKEYVTGFHKRKLLRKKEAQRQLEEKAKKSRQEERAKKRAELRARLDLDRYMTSESEAEEVVTQQDGKRDVRAFARDGISTTVTIAPFSLNSDSDSEEDIPSQKAREGNGNAGPRTARPGPAEDGPKAAEGGRQQVKGTFSKFARPVTNDKKQAGAKAHPASVKRKGKGKKGRGR